MLFKVRLEAGLDEEQGTQDTLSCIETYSGQAWLEDMHQRGGPAEEPLPTPLCVYRQEAGTGRWLRNKDSILGEFALGTWEPTSMTSSSPCDLTQTCLLLSYQERRRQALRMSVQGHWSMSIIPNSNVFSLLSKMTLLCGKFSHSCKGFKSVFQGAPYGSYLTYFV